MDLKTQEINRKSKRMRGAPEPRAPAPATGYSPRILFFISAHVWYVLRTNRPVEYHLSSFPRKLS